MFLAAVRTACVNGFERERSPRSKANQDLFGHQWCAYRRQATQPKSFSFNEQPASSGRRSSLFQMLFAILLVIQSLLMRVEGYTLSPQDGTAEIGGYSVTPGRCLRIEQSLGGRYSYFFRSHITTFTFPSSESLDEMDATSLCINDPELVEGYGQMGSQEGYDIPYLVYSRCVPQSNSIRALCGTTSPQGKPTNIINPVQANCPPGTRCKNFCATKRKSLSDDSPFKPVQVQLAQCLPMAQWQHLTDLYKPKTDSPASGTTGSTMTNVVLTGAATGGGDPGIPPPNNVAATNPKSDHIAPPPLPANVGAGGGGGGGAAAPAGSEAGHRRYSNSLEDGGVTSANSGGGGGGEDPVIPLPSSSGTSGVRYGSRLGSTVSYAGVAGTTVDSHTAPPPTSKDQPGGKGGSNDKKKPYVVGPQGGNGGGGGGGGGGGQGKRPTQDPNKGLSPMGFRKRSLAKHRHHRH